MRTQIRKTSGLLLLLLLYFGMMGTPLTVTPTITQPCALGTGAVTFSVSGGAGPFTYKMYDDNTGVTYGPQSSATFSGLNIGSYDISVYSANDSGFANFDIASPVSLSAWALNSVCGSNNGSAGIYVVNGGTAPYTCHWSNGDSTQQISHLPPAYYSVYATDANGCRSDTSLVQVSDSGSIAVGISVSGSYCNPILTATDSPGGTYTYLWSTGATSASIVAGTTYTYYTLTATNSNGCSGTTGYFAGSGIMASQQYSDPTCGSSNGTAHTHGLDGSGLYSYHWSTGSTSDSIIGAAAGIYLVTVTDDSTGCYTIVSDTLRNLSSLSVSTRITEPTCSGSTGSIVPIVGGGTAPFTYQWNTGSSADSLTGLSAGQYAFTVHDASGCFGTDSVTLSVTRAHASIYRTINPTCGASNGLLVARGNDSLDTYSYHWSTGSTSDSIFGLSAQVYIVTVTDDNTGCSKVITDTLHSASSLTISASTVNPSCSGDNGSIALHMTSGTAPYTYSWSTGSTADSIGGLAAGAYYVTVNDAGGCSGVATIDLSANTISAHIFTQANPTCGASNGTLVAYVYNDSSSYSYHWSGGQTTDSITGLPPGLYDVTITDLNTGCSAVASDTLHSNSSFTIVEDSLTPPTCGTANGVLSISVYNGSGSYSYLWSNGATTAYVSGLAAGSYTVTVTDNTGGCTGTATFSLSPVPGFQVSVVGTPTSCDSSLGTGTATAYITGTGIAPYSFAWYNWANVLIGSTQTITGLTAEYINVVVTDAGGCSVSAWDSIVPSASCYDNIIGQVFIDSNGNCIPDSGEQGVEGTYVQAISSTGQVYYAYIDTSGYFDIEVTPGIYQVTVYAYNYGLCLASLCTNSYSDTFTATGQISTGNNFGFGIGTGFDLAVHPGCYSSSPGDQKEYWVYYYNQGSAAVSNAVVTFSYDPSLTLLSTNPAYSSIDAATHIITWSVGTVEPTGFEWYQKLTMVFQVPATDSLGQVLYAQAEITPISGDCDPDNNIVNISNVVTASHDPNEKTVSPAGNLSASDTVLTYTIRFQNTGTAPANTVVVIDTLSPNVNPATVVPGASSAPYTFKMSGHGIMTFTFQGINLPDSTHGDSSIGYVMYTVHTNPNLALGSVINNTASIYFDLNPAVVTNTTTNERSNANGIRNISGEMAVSVIPNPAHEQAVIAFTGSTGTIALRITDALGEVITSSSVDNNAYTLDAQSLASGIYFYTATDAAGHKASGKISVVH